MPTTLRTTRPRVQVFVWLYAALLAALLALGSGCASRAGENGGSGTQVLVRGQMDMGIEKSGGIR